MGTVGGMVFVGIERWKDTSGNGYVGCFLQKRSLVPCVMEVKNGYGGIEDGG